MEVSKQNGLFQNCAHGGWFRSVYDFKTIYIKIKFTDTQNMAVVPLITLALFF